MITGIELNEKTEDENIEDTKSDNVNHHTDYEEYFAIFMSINAIIQFIIDIFIDIFHIIPLRINFLSLDILSAFTSFKDLSAIHKDKFGFLHEDIQVSFLVETLLMLGDLFFMFYTIGINNINFWYNFYIRIPFVIIKICNLSFIIYIIIKYKLYHITFQG